MGDEDRPRAAVAAEFGGEENFRLEALGAFPARLSPRAVEEAGVLVEKVT